MFLAPMNQFFLTIISTVTATVYSGLFGENKGVALGIIGSAESIGGILGPLLGGYLFSSGGVYFTYLACTIFSVIPLVIHYLPGFRK
jgi:MFS family permease